MLLWNRAAVVGVPGIGKTSLCKAISIELGYHYINYGELMLEIAIERDLAHNLGAMLQVKSGIAVPNLEISSFTFKECEKSSH